MSGMLHICGKPTFLLGVNYWSRAGGPRMWDPDRFDEGAVRRELQQMQRIGLNTCRCFTFIPSFMPRPPELSQDALCRFSRFLDLCKECGMTTIPSALVGHMSGENHDFPGQRGRCLYTDPEVLSWEQALVGAVARAGAGHPAVIAYLASNEMPHWGGRSVPEVIVPWASALRQALVAEDPHRPFSLGDGVMSLEGGQDGFDPRALRNVVDFVGPHTYHADCDPLRQALNVELCVRSLTHLGLPVLLEELGCSTMQASEENQALFYREAISACLSAGAAGALTWCFSDLDLAGEPPYCHHAFELGFGVTRADGSEKPVCNELRRLRMLLDRIERQGGIQPPLPRAAMVVPSYFNTTYPFSCEDRQRMRRTLLQAYVLCAAAGLETELVPEGTDLGPYPLVLLPCTQKLLAPTWEDLLRHARHGGTVYWSYFGGDSGSLQGAWCQLFTELTGCRHGLRYGCCDLPPATVRLEGSGLALATETGGGPPWPRAYLPLLPAGAEVLAQDGLGRPALTRHRHGSGQVVFLNHPWEHYLGQQADVSQGDRSHTLYRLLARLCEKEPRVTCSEGVVQVRVTRTGDGGDLLWLLNHGWEIVSCTVDSPGGEAVLGDEPLLDPGSCKLELLPKQVAVYRLRDGCSSAPDR